jgi:Alpha/beta hydrolase family
MQASSSGDQTLYRTGLPRILLMEKSAFHQASFERASEWQARPCRMPATGDNVTCRSMRFQERLQFICMIFFASNLPALSKDASSPRSTGPITHTLILDGIWGSHSRWERLRSRIATELGPCRIWRYDNSGRASIESLAKALAAELKRLNAPVNLVGYSMGGLVVREALRQTPELKVHRVALLNSPNYGSAAACLLPLSACREMRPGSAFLKQLNAAPWTHPTLATWCPYDLMVFPGSSGRWKKATVVLRSDVPMHLWPVVSVEIHRTVTAFLASSEAPPLRTRK